MQKIELFYKKKIYEKGKELFNNNNISWIIDDDHLFVYDTKIEMVRPNYFKVISEQANNKIDAMFGQSSDAPPLPFLSTLRTQLIDFYYNLTYFSNCDPTDKFKLNMLQKNSIEHDEFYYDLSNNNFQHLEYPYYWETEELANFEAFIEFLTEAELLSNGATVFRKMTYQPETIGKIIKKSIYRGGNTIIYNQELLKTPNYSPEEGYNRRSDFNWAIINQKIFNRQLYKIILPLKHDRSLQKTPLKINEQKIEADIKGLIFYRLLDKILSNANWECANNSKQNLKFYTKIKKDIFLKIKINNYRIQTLIHLILDTLKDKNSWWFGNNYLRDMNYSVQKNIVTMEILRIELGRRKFQIFLRNLENKMIIDDDFILKIIAEMKKIKENDKYA